jgi:hypothetical protein
MKTASQFRRMAIHFNKETITFTAFVRIFLFGIYISTSYVIHVASFSVNNEPWLVRTISLGTGSRVGSFCHAVRTRDRRCVITGEEAVDAEFGHWEGFEATHIFPLAYENHWISNDFSRWITMPSATGTLINTVRNGILLRSDIHQLFDSYLVSINPDVYIPSSFRVTVANSGFRIITRSSALRVMGRVLLVGISIRSSSTILPDLLISSCVGISGRQSWPI